MRYTVKDRLSLTLIYEKGFHMKYDTAVIIGRFQPVHNAHVELINSALRLANQVVILVGSTGLPRTYKNPWTFDDRIRMLGTVFNDRPINERIHIEPLRDHLYNETAWIVSVQESVAKYTNSGDKIILVGHKKDKSSYYLDMFPQWAYQEVESFEPLDATSVRELYFREDATQSFIAGVIPNSVYNILSDFRNSDEYADIIREREFIEKYRKQFENLPYPPVFVTADAVVFCLGHVLMVRRRAFPGKGLWALPGGFLNAETDVSMESCALRELKEETKIDVPPRILQSKIVSHDVFDAIDRSSRGRTITHAFNIQLSDTALPKIKGGSDAESAAWIPIGDLRSEECFEDHFQILEHYVGS